ncbi:MAG: Omp28-related outer membrane protein [Bacteroidota bacterium]
MRRFGMLLVAALLAWGWGAQTAGAAPRKVLAELFTATTCSPCWAPDNFYFYQWLPSYGGADMIVTVAYHVWWPAPGNDPMYLANPTPVQTRTNYYMGGTRYVPRMYVDGFLDGTNAYATWPGLIEPRFLDPSPISIALTGTRNGNTLSMNARIYGDLPVVTTNWRIHWVVAESGISANQNSPSGYVPFIHHVAHRAMIPADGSGTPFTISQGQTVDVPQVIVLDPSWVAAECRVVVFVQNMADRKVQNAEEIRVDAITAVHAGDPPLPVRPSLEGNFPNPFNPGTEISFALPAGGPVRLRIYSLLGEAVRTLLEETRSAGTHTVRWDGRTDGGGDAPSGVYICEMTSGGVRQAHKMMLLR